MIADMHNDILTSGLGEKEIKEYLEGALKNCRIVTMAAWTSDSTPSLSSLKETFEKYREYSEGRENFGKAVFAVEDMGFLRGDNLDGKLKEFFELPIAYAGLVWNNENIFGGGAFSEASLTETGKRTVKLFNSSSAALDFAHMNKKTFYAAAEVYEKPILCSHTCFDECAPNNAPLYNIARARNLYDEQVKIIVQSNGLIGLTFVATFLNGTPSCTSDDAVRHIDYFVQKYGHGHLGIGTDYFGTKEIPADIKEYKDFNILSEKLLKLGYAKTAINAIFGDNYKRFLDNLLNS